MCNSGQILCKIMTKKFPNKDTFSISIFLILYLTVNGLWGTWSEWSSCNRPCNGGRQRMKRRCDSPEPQFGGKYCIGIAEKIKSCANHSCESE